VFTDALHGLAGRVEDVVQSGLERVTEETGGPARRRVVVLLAAVLGLQSADVGTIAALAFQLERVFHIGNPELGLLVTVSSLVGAAGTIPMGAVADRFPRVRVLTIAVAVWALAQGATGFATSFPVLLGIRVALGAVTSAGGPIVASLSGDLFPPKDRGRMWGFILTGEVLGTGIGILLAGLVANWFNWRVAFFVLAVPSVVLAWFVRRLLPEPARGGQSRLEVGATEIPAAKDMLDRSAVEPGPAGGVPEKDDLVPRLVRKSGVRPDESIVLAEDPEKMNLWQAVRYILRVRTNVVIISASAVGYFFFTGLETFAIIFLRGHYGVGAGMASFLLVAVGAGVIAGLVVAGRIGDAKLRKGVIDARLLVGVVGFIGAALLLAPAIASPWLALSVPLYVAAGALVAAPNPGLDAARLDVVPARMWGRAEGVRTLLRQSLQAFAPLIFGLVSVVFGGNTQGIGAGVNLKHQTVSAAQAHALEYTFLVMLVPVVIGGLVLLVGRSSYPVDVASAAESDRRSGEIKRHIDREP
jgi:MFS family permease